MLTLCQACVTPTGSTIPASQDGAFGESTSHWIQLVTCQPFMIDSSIAALHTPTGTPEQAQSSLITVSHTGQSQLNNLEDAIFTASYHRSR